MSKKAKTIKNICDKKVFITSIPAVGMVFSSFPIFTSNKVKTRIDI